MEVEYGSCRNIRIIDPSQIRMIDCDGNDMLCKCGNVASTGIYDKEAYIAYCNNCDPMKDQVQYNLVYKDINENDPRYQKAKELLKDDLFTL